MSSIPTPPFETQVAAREFARTLSLYVATLNGDGPVDLATFALLTLLEVELKDLGDWRPVAAVPSPTALRVALTTYFPAPWTPHGLNDVIDTVLYPQQHQGWWSEPGLLRWSDDPTFTAVRQRGGQWYVTRSERGVIDTFHGPVSDDDMVLYRMGFERSSPTPFGHFYDNALLPALDAAARSMRQPWNHHTELPYLRDWRKP